MFSRFSITSTTFNRGFTRCPTNQSESVSARRHARAPLQAAGGAVTMRLRMPITATASPRSTTTSDGHGCHVRYVSRNRSVRSRHPAAPWSARSRITSGRTEAVRHSPLIAATCRLPVVPAPPGRAPGPTGGHLRVPRAGLLQRPGVLDAHRASKSVRNRRRGHAGRSRA